MLSVYYTHCEKLRSSVSLIYGYQNYEENIEHFIVPFIGSAICFIENGKLIKDNENHYTIIESPGYDAFVHLMLLRPIRVHIKCKMQAIIFVFKPLGLNKFIPLTVGQLKQKFRNNIIRLSDIPRMSIPAGIFKGRSLEQKIMILEKWLGKKQKPFVNAVLEEALPLLNNVESNIGIKKICTIIGTSHKTLYRLFRNYIGVTPVQYKIIAQFRYAINFKMHKKNVSLSEVALDSNYSDQAYFIRTFRKLSGMAPLQFFIKLGSIDNKKFI